MTEDKKKETAGMLKEMMDQKDSIFKMLDEWKAKMPQGIPKRVRIKGFLATAGLQLDGSINIRFDNADEGKKFFEGLK